jgi:sphingolipid 4-desaturase/C4-monooxygenase
MCKIDTTSVTTSPVSTTKGSTSPTTVVAAGHAPFTMDQSQSPSKDNRIPTAKETTTTTNEPRRSDFYWSTENEPHATRRRLILQQYPQIRSLYGHCTLLKYKIAAAVCIQLFCAYQFRHQFFHSDTTTTADNITNNDSDTTTTTTIIAQQFPWYVFWITAYVIGGTCNHMCMMGLHELSHNLGFKIPKYNQYYAIFVSNLPLVVPAAVSFKRYHMDHHKYQGVDGMDVDIPTILEGNFFHTTFRKFFFVTFQMAFYAIRPLLVNPKPKNTMEFINFLYMMVVNATIVYCWGTSSVLYLAVSTILGMGLHPCAGHFIAEHFVFPSTNTTTNNNSNDDDYQNCIVPETYSYYGVVNYFTFNVGYHNEHHDFPFIPGSRLPQVYDIAKEYYAVLPHHTSYMKVMYDYITMPSVTSFSRVKRINTMDDPDGVTTDDQEETKTTLKPTLTKKKE